MDAAEDFFGHLIGQQVFVVVVVVVVTSRTFLGKTRKTQ